MKARSLILIGLAIIAFLLAQASVRGAWAQSSLPASPAAGHPSGPVHVAPAQQSSPDPQAPRTSITDTKPVLLEVKPQPMAQTSVPISPPTSDVPPAGTSSAARTSSMSLYPHDDFTLQSTPQSGVHDIPIRPAWPEREWTYTLDGDITGDQYYFDLTLYNLFPYYPYYTCYSIELILDQSGDQTVLVGADLDCIVTTTRFYGTVTGLDPQANSGDTLIYRISHRAGAYGGTYIGGDTNAHIEIPSSGSSLPTDFDGNCVVDLADIMLIVGHWRETDTSPNWDPVYDLDGDEAITIVDIMIVVADWGETCS